MNYSYTQHIETNVLFRYEEYIRFFNVALSYLEENLDKPDVLSEKISVYTPDGQSILFDSVNDFVSNFSRNTNVRAIELRLLFKFPSNEETNSYFSITVYNGTEIKILSSSPKQPQSINFVDDQISQIAKYLSETYSPIAKHTAITKIDSILSTSKLAYMLLGAIVTIITGVIVSKLV